MNNICDKNFPQIGVCCKCGQEYLLIFHVSRSHHLQNEKGELISKGALLKESTRAFHSCVMMGLYIFANLSSTPNQNGWLILQMADDVTSTSTMKQDLKTLQET